MSGDRPVPTTLLLDALPDKEVKGDVPAAVAGLAYDSRKVEPGCLFVAVRGLRTDGRRFVPEALSRGAAGVVAEPPDPLPGERRLRVLVPDTREALARLADAYYRSPSGDLLIVGITGTNGKTTTSYLVEALLRADGHATGVIGTIQYRIGETGRPAGQTTPESPELQALLAEMRDAGVTACAMEVSSHALELCRVEGIRFRVGVFTNLTQDHLDFHGSMVRYQAAKARLFAMLPPDGWAILNADDPAHHAMAERTRARVLTYGVGPGAQVRATRWSSALAGVTMTVETPAGRMELTSPLIGGHNVSNLLAATGVGIALGIPPARIGAVLAQVHAVPGRFERVDTGQPFLVVVDYAHTPDALERVLETARKLTPGRLGVVFGCGGDRDRGKRPRMGEIAARLADFTWITSDNPRSEDPESIIRDIVAEARSVSGSRESFAIVPDRAEAIRRALEWARAGDTVLMAGKGHETYQIIGSAVLPFDDREVARAILKARP